MKTMHERAVERLLERIGTRLALIFYALCVLIGFVLSIMIEVS